MTLRLQRTKDAKIHLTVRSQSGLFTKEFSLACFIALALHLSAFFLFKIDLGAFLSKADWPKTLEAFSDPYSSEITAFEEDPFPDSFPSFLKMQIPSPSLPAYISEPQEKAHLTSAYDLTGLEQETTHKKPHKSHFSLSHGYLFLNAPTQLFSDRKCHARLAFRASSTTGKIYYLDWIESTHNPKLDQKIIESLKAALLKPEESPLTLQGIIEIEFLS